MSSKRLALSVVETLRVMDVAREVRKSGRPAEHAMVDSEFHAALREHLLQTARQAGDAAEAVDIEAAIETYLASRLVYTDPPWSLSLLLAHLWVRRRAAILTVLMLLGGLLILWLLSFLRTAIS